MVKYDELIRGSTYELVMLTVVCDQVNQALTVQVTSRLMKDCALIAVVTIAVECEELCVVECRERGSVTHAEASIRARLGRYNVFVPELSVCVGLNCAHYRR